MSISPVLQSRWFRVAVVAIVIVAGLGAMAIPKVQELFSHNGESKDAKKNGKDSEEGAEFIQVGNDQGLRLAPETAKSLDVKAVKVVLATKERPLPPQIGTLNYDNDRVFSVPSRFPGELIEVRGVVDTDSPISPTRERPLRFGDRLKQGDLLAVVWSQQFGTSKAALVDAVGALRLSQATLKRYEDLDKKGVVAEATLRLAERQVQVDTNTLLTAERSLRMWRLTDKEIDDIKSEAQMLLDQKKARKADDEMKWARVEIRVPIDRNNPNQDLVLVEKNTNLNAMVDPINSPPLFKLADTSRLQICVFPPEEYLPIITEGLSKRGPGRMRWDVRFLSDPANMPPRQLDIVQISPALEPTMQRPMVLGYMPNPEGKYRVGQTVTATIYVPPDENTVEIPTNALNQVEGQALVFVQSDLTKNDYTLRRIPIVRSFKDVTYVRTKLTEEEKKMSEAEVAAGRRPMQPLLPGEHVVTGMVVQMTSALEDLAVKQRASKEREVTARK